MPGYICSDIFLSDRMLKIVNDIQYNFSHESDNSKNEWPGYFEVSGDSSLIKLTQSDLGDT